MSYIEVSGNVSDKLKVLASDVATKVIDLMGFADTLEVAIDFVDENEIQRLNKEFREIDRVTDVLSFPSFGLVAGEKLDVTSIEAQMSTSENGFIHFGDMAICLEQTERQAKEYGVTTEAEVKKLVIHSMLHLMGYDHIEDSDYEVMNKKEIELDGKIEI
ncbi:MAG: rRNA maturation RNase YbeY [Clostridiales bacterium]|nr:rRNA maturation RNase YbeY [Clostridiales bacterium]